MVGNRKRQTEIGINMFGSNCLLLQQDGLAELEGKDPNEVNFHIYMIARRARISIDPESITIDHDFIRGLFLINDKGKFIPKDFTLINHLKTSDIEFVCPYPHTEFFIYDSDKRLISSGKAALLLQTLNGNYFPQMSLEILYIGQSYGADGEKTAIQRLKSHSTLQNIYADIIRQTPDKEIWILLWSFSPIVITAFDSSSGVYETTDKQDISHIRNFHKKFITEQQRINFTEAALIRHFEPEYNIMYKNNFPNPAHKTYSECYDLDVHSINVELQTENINCQLFSSKIEPLWIHLAQFPLHNSAERESILNYGWLPK
ncbi:MAG: hypothetical protein RBU23_13625 [Candidatus Auribacterota bacterium]|jgi:hypothetical protein|nr:hypothetical protein [Candidatus Auribacterota bacterium]